MVLMKWDFFGGWGGGEGGWEQGRGGSDGICLWSGDS